MVEFAVTASKFNYTTGLSVWKSGSHVLIWSVCQMLRCYDSKDRSEVARLGSVCRIDLFVTLYGQVFGGLAGSSHLANAACGRVEGSKGFV